MGCWIGLLTEQIVGVASGRAEFGPRALGNRSLLADPRGSEIKEKVNEIKRRQQFRPFAPVILEELADTYFDMPSGFSIVGICSQSLVVGILSYFLLSFMLMALVVYKLFPKTDRA
jgi:hypothetical protein